MSAEETIFALSSGQPPAAIGVIRISGPQTTEIIEKLSEKLPEPRRASMRTLRDPDDQEMLDQALLIWFPGPNSATGEDLAEIHCHGGRAVIRAIEQVLGRQTGLRRAEPGEFTRRAFINGRMDLAEAEGLSDLLFAETEIQRRSAIQRAGGRLSQRIAEWQAELLNLSALVEAELDFSDEDDVAPAQLDILRQHAARLAQSMKQILDRPRAEKMRDGVRVVLGGPPNSGKSTLLNALVEREAAIVSAQAGTTRDVIEVPVSIGGIPFLITDTAGLRESGAEEVEQIGIARAHDQFALADMILWLGPEGEGPAHDHLIEISPQSDRPDFVAKSESALKLSAKSGQGMDQLVTMLSERARDLLPRPDQIAVNERQGALLTNAHMELEQLQDQVDYLILAEHLRLARQSLDALTGKASTEDMLDRLFGAFCIGK